MEREPIINTLMYLAVNVIRHGPLSIYGEG
jgi:hypothetical protein